eukprot:9476918-Pyramimonas_sp.AAC.1
MAFPGYSWDPVEVNLPEWEFEPQIPEILTGKDWYYQQALFPAIVWYFSQLRWAADDTPMAPMSVSWAELAIDFTICTGLPL